jgi:hypothetical protein
MKTLAIAAALLLSTVAANACAWGDYDCASRRNEAMRLELERFDLEQKLRYRRASKWEIAEELLRYCPNGEPPCRQQPPDSLLQEASRRGLIILSPPATSRLYTAKP